MLRFWCVIPLGGCAEAVELAFERMSDFADVLACGIVGEREVSAIRSSSEPITCEPSKRLFEES
jgi:hypothetical protein